MKLLFVYRPPQRVPRGVDLGTIEQVCRRCKTMNVFDIQRSLAEPDALGRTMVR